MTRIAVLLSVFAAGLMAWCVAPAQDKKQPEAAASRKPWTTSKVVGSPDPPPPYKAVRAFPDAKFHHPLLMARCPGTDRLFVGEQEGVLYSLANRPDAKKEPFFDLRTELKSLDKTPAAKGIGELYGLVFHPKFEENRYCYVCYTLEPKDRAKGRLTDGSRVSRFVVPKADPPRIDPASEHVVITFQGGGHNGGDLHFGPDGMLYISTGDGSGPNPPDVLNTGQDCSDLLSSILRIDVDHPDAGKNYGVPKDNPFVGLPDVRPEIWAFGFRNPWRMSFDRQTGALWVGDVGWESWESVVKVEKGGNYGWSISEARLPVKPDQKPGPAPIRPPTIEVPHTLGTSVTGGYVYRGRKFPELAGSYVFGDWETRRVWAARFDGDRLVDMPEITKLGLRMSAFGEDNAGELYILEYDTGLIYTLERNDAKGKNTTFPTKLSETGVFSSVKDHAPAEGVVPFEPNVPQWQDGATAVHLAALPGLSAVTVFDKPRPLPGQVFWHDFKTQFPPDAVLVKTLYLDVLVNGSPVKKRVETQLLHCDGEDWRAYTFAWRDDQTDADLVPADGAEKVFEVPTRHLPHPKREYVWTFHSRSQCMTCHNSWAEYALAFNPRQLNVAMPTERPRPNQLVRLSQAGYVRRVGDGDRVQPPFDAASATKEAALVPTSDPHSPADLRARSYIHANCAHCHRFGGGGGQVVLELDFNRPLKETGILDVRPRQGDFGLTDARVVKPGRPDQSVLYYRMAKFGRGRMPHLGSEHPDWHGLDVVGAWIAGLGDDHRPYPPPNPITDGFAATAGNPTGALPFARAIGTGSLKGDDSARLLADAAKLPAGPVRDLFDGYLPPDPRGRKLGSNPRPASILAMTGDPKRGEAIFFAEAMQCAKCHKVGEKGVPLGPELTEIGKTRTRAEILDSLLQPSAKVEPKFASYLVKTADGRSFTGLLVKRDDKQLVLRDAENKEVVLAAADVEAVQPSRLSLMPDGLVSGLTPQEAADLLEFLSTRK